MSGVPSGHVGIEGGGGGGSSVLSPLAGYKGRPDDLTSAEQMQRATVLNVSDFRIYPENSAEENSEAMDELIYNADGSAAIIQFNEGAEYKFADIITVPFSAWIRGVGGSLGSGLGIPGGTKLTYEGAAMSGASFINKSNSPLSCLWISDIAIDATPNLGNAVNLGYGYFCRLFRSSFIGGSKSGIRLSAASWVQINDCFVKGSGEVPNVSSTAAILFDSEVANTCTYVKIENCDIDGSDYNDGILFRMIGGGSQLNNVEITGNNFEPGQKDSLGLGGYSVRVESNDFTPDWYNIRIDNNSTSSNFLNSAGFVKIVDWWDFV